MRVLRKLTKIDLKAPVFTELFDSQIKTIM
jgi:hypothetical protein